jgi:hypothetical protein
MGGQPRRMRILGASRVMRGFGSPQGCHHLTKKLLPAAASGGLRANRPRPCRAWELDFSRDWRGTWERGGGGRFSNF